ncbi:MAG: alpha/beta hydrolase [Bryobacteraceae bacterium]|nr:alpha/beta hydrolase [Bryobacteraceae bacterium]
MTTSFATGKGRDPWACAFPDLVNPIGCPQVGQTDKSPADIEDLTIPGGPKGTVSIRIVRPKGNTSMLPAVLYFRGNGWVPGGNDTHDRSVREIANGAGAAVVVVNFATSSEGRFAPALEEACAATRYVADCGKQHNLDASYLAVAGDGAGGNLAAAVTLLAKHHHGLQIVCQVLFYPVTDAGCYICPNFPTSALGTSTDQMKGLPPAVVITCEFDALREDGEAYAAKLREAGADVTAVRYFGLCHDFLMMDAVSQSAQAQGAIALATSNLRKAFTLHQAPTL